MHHLPHAPVPFWFWNGEQDPARIDDQLAEAARAGFAGMAIHARVGNRTPYLSERWFELVRHACVRAQALHLEIWIYDEADYPSGTVGNRIQQADPSLRQQSLMWTTCTAAAATRLADVVACFRRAVPNQPCDPRTLPSDEGVLAFHIGRLDRYVDTLNPQTCAEFMRLTHENYARHLGGLLGTTVTTIYTDDVNYRLQGPVGLGWTSDLPTEFARRHGYELIPYLPALIADLPGSEQSRIDFHRTLLDLFLERWVRPQADWCDRYGLRFIGHLRGDEGPLWMLTTQCGAAMPYFAAQDTPSIDDFLLRARDGDFTRRTRTDYGLSPTLLYRQAASVADQFGDGCVSSEILASMGWGAGLAEAHRHLLFEQLLGINVLTHHAVAFATAGLAKRDHPPSWFSQQPWWPAAGATMMARQTRLCGWLREGVAEVDVCVIFPTTAAWSCLRAMDHRPAEGWPKDLGKSTSGSLEEQLAQLCLALVRAHVPFHFVDELLLEQHGLVEKGRLCLGAGNYHHVILPPWPHIASTTRKLLLEAVDSGVAVHGWGAVPLIGNMPHPDLNTMVAALPPAWPALDGDVVIHARSIDDHRVLLAGNCSNKERSLTPPGAGGWQVIDLASDALVHQGRWPETGLVLPADACWRIAPGTTEPERVLPAAPSGTMRWRIPTWRLASRPPTLAVFDRARAPHGQWIGLRGKAMTQDRPEWLEIPLAVPSGVQVLAIYGEQIDLLSPLLDGRSPSAPEGHHPCSPDLKRIACRLGSGDHCLRIHPRAIRGAIEDVIIELEGMVDPVHDAVLGWLPHLVPWQDPVVGLDLARQGLPFHWGPIDFVADVLLEDPTALPWIDLGAGAGAIEVTVDGRRAGCLWHEPWRLHLGQLLHGGVNQLGLRCWGTAQNLLGPHRTQDALVWSPPELDIAAPNNPYFFAKIGVLDVPRLINLS